MKIGDLVQLKKTIHHHSGVISDGKIGIIISSSDKESKYFFKIPGCCMVKFSMVSPCVACHKNEIKLIK